MTLTPLDIHNKEFNRAFRGYSEAEVDEFLDLVVKEFEALIRENGELKDRLDDLERTLERYRTIEDSLNKTLLLAQQAAEEVRQSGEKEAELIRERARMEGQRIVDEARAKAKQSLEEYSEVRREVELFRMRMKTMLSAQLELLEETAFKSGERPLLSLPAAGGTGPVEETGVEEPVGRGGAIGDEEEPDEPPGSEEAAAIDFRRMLRGRPGLARPAEPPGAGTQPGPVRPNLWGEPASPGDASPGRAEADDDRAGRSPADNGGAGGRDDRGW